MRQRKIYLMGALLVSMLAMTGAASAYHNGQGTFGGGDLQRTRVAGVVETIEGQEAYIRTDYGERIGLQLGPESYWDGRDCELSCGDYVTADCWFDPSGRNSWYFVASIWGPGFSISLLNDYGVPYWVRADDYYYRNCGPCCDTYVIWYDCTPTYFIYLPLPPPRYYVYYGPHWRHHHRDWRSHWYRDHHDYHGPRRGDWDRRDGRRGRDDDDHNGYERRGRDYQGGYDGGNYRRAEPPRVRVQPGPTQSVKPNRGYNNEVKAPPTKPRPDYDTRVQRKPAPQGKVYEKRVESKTAPKSGSYKKVETHREYASRAQSRTTNGRSHSEHRGGRR